MKYGFFSEHWYDANHMPAGGITSGRGFVIAWQNGPLGQGNQRKEPSGAFVEDVIAAVIDRIEYYQNSTFNCSENAEALTHLRQAATVLDARTKERESRGVEGTHQR